jgi:hypothetical protein
MLLELCFKFVQNRQRRPFFLIHLQEIFETVHGLENMLDIVFDVMLVLQHGRFIILWNFSGLVDNRLSLLNHVIQVSLQFLLFLILEFV